MKRLIFIILIVIVSINSYSQITFEKGYFIKNDDKKIECLIKNTNWLNNPTEFIYKLSKESEAKKISIKEAKEFAIQNTSKYIRTAVKIDRSSEDVNKLSIVKKPIFNDDTLFLKVLIEGKANLYTYEDKGLIRFFHNVDNSEIVQLVYKSYLNSDDKVAKNRAFRQQLWVNLKCTNITIDEIKKLKYNKKDLMNIFLRYNKCNNATTHNIKKTPKKDLFNLTLRPGLRISSFKTQSDAYLWSNVNFDHKIGYRLGIEAEFILPSNNNKWSFLFEPTYQYYKAEKTFISNKTTGSQLIGTINYKSIEVPVSLRHYFFLNKKERIFINGSLIFDFCFDSSLNFKRPESFLNYQYELESNINLGIGVGYKYYNKYSAELRFSNGRELLGRNPAWRSQYKTLSLIFGYSLF